MQILDIIYLSTNIIMATEKICSVMTHDNVIVERLIVKSGKHNVMKLIVDLVFLIKCLYNMFG